MSTILTITATMLTFELSLTEEEYAEFAEAYHHERFGWEFEFRGAGRSLSGKRFIRVIMADSNDALMFKMRWSDQIAAFEEDREADKQLSAAQIQQVANIKTTQQLISSLASMVASRMSHAILSDLMSMEITVEKPPARRQYGTKPLKRWER